MPQQRRLIDPVTELGLKIGDRVRVLGKRSDASIKGSVLEVDDVHLIIQTRPGYEEILLRGDVAAIRPVRFNAVD